MAATTVTGSLGNGFVFPTSTPLQTSLAQQVLGTIFASAASQYVTGAGGTITSSAVLDTSANGSVLTGAAGLAAAQIALGGQNGTYITGGAAFSAVVAADYSGSSIVNNNPAGGLLGVTGAGGNVLLGLAGVNQFITGIAGQDLVNLSGAANALLSNGSDAVLVGGPSTITAAASGNQSVLMTSGTTLNFINGSRAGLVDSITGAAGSTVYVAGTGATSITAGAGPETFFVDTSSGQVTLNGNLSTSAVLEFVQNAAQGTASVTVSNFAAGQSVYLHNYAGYNVSASSTNPAGSMLQLSDGSQVTFNNASISAVQAAIKVV